MTYAQQPSLRNGTAKKTKVQAELVAYLAGSKPLWKAFGLVFVLGNVVFQFLGVAIFLAAYALTTHSLTTSSGVAFDPYQVGILVALVLGAYFVFSTLVVWRCASNSAFLAIRYGVRIFALLTFALWLWRFLGYMLSVAGRSYG
jgi:hypothetical protein